MRDNDIKPNQLADASGVSRQHLLRLRFGKAEPTRPVMIWLTIGCRGLLGRRRTYSGLTPAHVLSRRPERS